MKKGIFFKLAAMLFAELCLTAATAFAQNSGTCGENATWEYDESTKTLTFSGTGMIYNYLNEEDDNAPWYKYRSKAQYIVINSGITQIHIGTFYAFINVKNATIPNSVTSIGENAFYLVNNIEYNGSAEGRLWGAYCRNGYIDGDFIYSDNTKKELLRYVGQDTEVTIPDGVTSIGTCAFREIYKESLITSVFIPESVTSIGNSAFSYCTSLTSVTIPKNVTSIGDRAFSYCTSLTSITIPENVTSIGGYAFYNCTSLTSVTIQSVTSIGRSAFEDCTSLTSVTIPENVTIIGISAFEYCNQVSDVYCYADLDKIEEFKYINTNFNSSTKFHVFADMLDKWNEKYTDKKFTFVGDLKRMSDESITIPAQTYTGKALTPVVKDGEKTLVEGEDYNYHPA